MLKYSYLALALVLAAAVCVNLAFSEASGKYIGNKQCLMCRKTVVKQQYLFDHWATTKHAKATENLPADKKADPECLQCHSTGFGKPGGMTVEMAKTATPLMANVQCEGCHGPGEAHKTAPKEKKAETMNKPTKETCIVCHTETHPGGDVPGWKKFNYEEDSKTVAHPKAPDAK
ncbi:hypothetical protein HS125_12125 [bacterium]|nr:hypothetical protein [bacterium]